MNNSEINNESNSEINNESNNVNTDENTNEKQNEGFNVLGFITQNKMLFILFLIISSIWIFIFYILGRKQEEEGFNGNSTNILTIILFAFLIILIIFNTLTYFYNIDFETSIKQLSPETTNIDFDVDFNKFKAKNLIKKKEVFHIPNNKYDYENSKAMCKAYGARLATYSELEKAYDNGANWCSYGWSDNQMALFPTQKSTYDKLQNVPGHENDCGRPGVNGGYIENPNVKFGINCYGVKPEITPEEINYMKNMSLYPKNKNDLLFEKKVEHLKKQIPNILLNPFNTNKWSRF